MTRPLNQLQLAEHGADEINTLLKGERHYYRPVAEPTQLAVLETFLDAVYAHKKVIVDYRKRDGSIDKDYVFTPLSIEHFDYYWYVRGYKEVDTTKGAKGMRPTLPGSYAATGYCRSKSAPTPPSVSSRALKPTVTP